MQYMYVHCYSKGLHVMTEVDACCWVYVADSMYQLVHCNSSQLALCWPAVLGQGIHIAWPASCDHMPAAAAQWILQLQQSAFRS